jgi:hypothetical protein
LSGKKIFLEAAISEQDLSSLTALEYMIEFQFFAVIKQFIRRALMHKKKQSTVVSKVAHKKKGGRNDLL